MTMDQMLKDEELIREKIMVPQFAPDEVIPEDAAKEVERECIYLPPFYYAEVGVANKLKKLSEEPAGDRLWVSLMRARQKTGNSELSVDVEKIQKAVNMKYDQVQAEADPAGGHCEGSGTDRWTWHRKDHHNPGNYCCIPYLWTAHIAGSAYGTGSQENDRSHRTGSQDDSSATGV